MVVVGAAVVGATAGAVFGAIVVVPPALPVDPVAAAAVVAVELPPFFLLPADATLAMIMTNTAASVQNHHRLYGGFFAA